MRSHSSSLSRAEPPTDEPVVEVINLNVHAAGIRLLSGIDLRIAPGECVAVVGRSGAGKSVLSRSLLGLASGGVGRVEVSADRLRIAGTGPPQLQRSQAWNEDRSKQAHRNTWRGWRHTRAHTIGYIPQDALGSLDPLVPIGVTIAETLRIQGIGPSQRRTRALAAMDAASLNPALVDALPHQLSGGMRQRALIAAAIAHEPHLLIADEPTSALDSATGREIMRTFGSIARSGTGILIISHDLISVQHVADRILVIDDGQLVESGAVTAILSDPHQSATRALVRAARAEPLRVSEDADTSHTRVRHEPAPFQGKRATAVTGTKLSRHYDHTGRTVRAVDKLSIEIELGHRWGIVGESGSGKSTLIRLLLALEPPDSGEVTLLGRPWSALRERARRSRRHEVAYVPQDVAGSFNPRTRIGRILRQAGAHDDSAVVDALTAVQLPPQLAQARVGVLSGGMRQRLAIARALVTGARILVCDEPFSALDAITLRDMLELLDNLAVRRELTLIIVTHDLAVVRSLCDSVAVMEEGRIVERGKIEQIWADPSHPATSRLLAAAQLDPLR